MERRSDESAPPWRVLGEPTSQAEPLAVGAGPALPLLAAGVAATIVLAILAFVLAGAPSDGAVVRVDGAGVAAGIGAQSSDGATYAPGAAGDVRGGVGAPNAPLVVDIGGAVARPGVYRLPPGSRVGDAIAAAGGFGSRVDAARASSELNLAATIADGDRIRVPSRDDPPPAPPEAVGNGTTTGGQGSGGGGESPTDAGSAGLLDLNTATATQLDGLPGIGQVLAGRIIESREEQPFRAVSDLRERGILGPATFAKVVDLVTVR